MAVASAVGQAISDYSDTNRVRLVDCTRYGCRLEVLHNKIGYEQTFFLLLKQQWRFFHHDLYRRKFPLVRD